MRYQHIAYLSHVSRTLDSSEIDALLLDAHKFNLEHNITGILLFDEDRFFQFFEGSQKNVEKAYERIKKSTRHKSILEIANRNTEVRYFKDWSMGFSYIPKTELQKISQSKWQKSLPKVEKYANECIGLAMLLAFCSDKFKDISINP